MAETTIETTAPLTERYPAPGSIRDLISLRPAAALLLVFLIVACGASGPGSEEIETALEEVRQGEAPAAVARLRQFLAHYPDGRPGDRAALVLGNVLLRRESYTEALDPLARAAQGSVAPRYAALLRVRVIVRAGLSELYTEALEEARSLIEEEAELVRPLVREEAHYLLLKLHFAREDWEQVSATGTDFQSRWPASSYLAEALWLTAEALRRGGRQNRAAELYATLWYDHLGSPWAVEAHQRLQQVEAATGVVTRRLSADERYELIEALQRFGLHAEALAELDGFRSGFPRHPKTDEALFRKAKSLHALRKNAECVATVEELKRRHPSSTSLPAAAIYAIKALRRRDNTRQIRRWADWIVKTYRGQPESFEALYNLGVYLGNVVSEEEGIRVLERLIREGSRYRGESGKGHANVVDALWKVAWNYRKLGRDAEAIAALERILEQHPESGYRKAALYWTARMLADRAPDRAVELYWKCVEEFPHDYYGHQSFESLLFLGEKPRRIGSDEAFPVAGILDDPSRTANAGDAVQAAVYLDSLGLYGFAAAELSSVEGAEEDLAVQFSLAELYSRSGDPWTAIDIVNSHFRSFAVSGSRNPDLVPRSFWYIVYPYNHRAAIQNAIREARLEEIGIEPYLIAALIRLESRFLPTAISPVGALGLMQLMPGTALDIADERGLPPPTRSELFDPTTNIRYGTFYLGKLVERFQGDWFPAICSYNAGAGAVRRWWDQRPPGQDIDEFVESIPYSATRRYVKRILGDFKNYQWLYRQDT